MDINSKKLKLFLALFLLPFFGCSLTEQTGKHALPSGLIITPTSYYSTLKARTLGKKYKQHLEQLVQQLVQNPVTGKLQFANNIAAVGGIGFFTHSSSRLPDERYLEVVLGAPEVFDDKVEFNDKVDRIFSLYGSELLSILTGDAAIYNDKDVAGYGLNLSWRVTSNASGVPRVGVERAVIYVSKEEASRFLDQGLPQNLLRTSFIYSIGTDGVVQQVAYAASEAGDQGATASFRESVLERQPEVAKAEIEPPIREQDLSPDKQPAPLAEQSIPERKVLAKAPKQLIRPEQEVKMSPSAKEEARGQESKPDLRSEVSEKSAISLREEVKTPPSSVVLAERSEPSEKKLGPTVYEEPSVSRKISEENSVVTKKEEVKVPAPPVEVLKRKETEETEVELKSTPQEEPAASKNTSEGSPVATEKDGIRIPPRSTEVQKYRETLEKKVEPRPLLKEQAPAPGDTTQKRLPTPKKEEIKEPAPSIEIAKRTLPLEEQPKPKLVLKEKVPASVEKHPVGKLPKPQEIHGYLIQLLFSDSAEAERWSDLLVREGYSTSFSMVRGDRIVRLRVGAFPSRAEAGRLLEKFQKQGLTGVVLFQAPKSRSSLAMKAGGQKTGPVSLEGEVIGRAKPVERRPVKQPQTREKDIESMASSPVQKEVAEGRTAAPKESTESPEKKQLPEERAAQKVVLKEKVPSVVERRPGSRLPKPQAVEGYLIQISFSDRTEAQRWSERLSREGYSTSMSMVRGEQSIRLRIGAFRSSAEAEHLLERLQKEGLAGFIVQALK